MADSLVAAQHALRSGDADGARRHYTEALAGVSLSETAESTDLVKGEAHLGLAEMTWEKGDKKMALHHYESALTLARSQGDVAREGMISLGLGFALLNSGDDADRGAALAAMRRSKELAEQSGQAQQADFVTSLIAQAERPIEDMLAPDRARPRWSDTFSVADRANLHGSPAAPAEPPVLDGPAQDPPLARGDWVIATPQQPDDGGGCGGCGASCALFGVLEDFVPERGRWALRLTNGRTCAAKAAQLKKTSFQPLQRIEVVGEDCGPLAGLCGEVVAFVPRRQRWTIELDVGYSTLARTDQLAPTERPPLKPALRQLQVLAWAKSSVSRASFAHLLPLDLAESIAGLVPQNPPIMLWAHFLGAEYEYC